MTKKILKIIVMGLAILMNLSPRVELAAATDETWQYDTYALYVTTQIFPGKENKIYTFFNLSFDIDVATDMICLFTYDENVATQAQVEADIANFQNNPEWKKGEYCKNHPRKTHFHAIDSHINFEEVGSDIVLSENKSGVIYAVMKLDWFGEEGPDWIWTKIDYHRCSYNPNPESDAGSDPDFEPSHLTETCLWTMDRNNLDFERVGGNLTPYTPWSEEWNQILTERLAELDGDITDWQGDETERDNIIQQLKATAKTAGDADEPDTIETKAQELLDRMQQRILDLTPKEPEEIITPQPEPDDEDKKQPIGGSTSGTTGNTNGAGMGSVNSGNEKDEEIDVPSQPELPSVVIEDLPAQREDIAVVTSNPSNTSNMSENTDESDNNTTSKTENNDNLPTTGIEIPALNGGEVTSKNWWIWILIGVTILIGLIVWWCKRAFWDNRAKKY